MVIMANISLCSLSVIFALVQLATCVKDLVDRDPIEATVDSLCKNSGDNRIGSVSTIYKLIQHFEASGESICKHEWYPPLQSLKSVLDASARDACSLESVEKIEEFHNFYVVGSLSKSWMKASKGSLPEPLRQFFVHFADATVARCKLAMGDRLREAVKSNDVDPSTLFDGKLGAFSELLSAVLTPREKISKFDDFLLVFNSLVDAEKRAGREVPEAVPDPHSGEVTYIYLKMKDASAPRKAQDKCRQELRPIYGNTILPVMKLLDLGYGTKGEKLHGNQQMIANWYTMAQLCEIISPIKYYEDKTLLVQRLSLVKKEDAGELDAQNGYDWTERPTNVQVKPARLEDALPDATDDGAVKRVKANIKSRSKIYHKIMKHFLGRFKKELKKFYKGIYVWTKNKVTGRYEEQPIDEATLEVVEKNVIVSEDKRSGALVRRKRGFVGGFLAFLGICVAVFLIVIFVCACFNFYPLAG